MVCQVFTSIICNILRLDSPGSPHAGSTSRASKRRWHLPRTRLPRKRGLAPLAYPPVPVFEGTLGVASSLERLQEMKKQA